MKCFVLLLAMVLAAVTAHPARAAGKRSLQVKDLFRFKRLSDPRISPDGKQVAYVVTSVDLDNNSTSSSIWLAPADGKGEPRQLTNVPGKKDRHPRWSPDGKWLLFESNRSGNNQLWAIPLSGGEAQQLTTISTEASTGLWSPDGKHIAFVSAVFPENSAKPFKESDALNKKRIEETEKSPVKAKVFKRLFIRHWDSYVEDKRQHLFVISFDDAKAGEPKDVTPGDRDAYPTSSTFSVGDDFTFSPDGKHLLFTAVPEKNEAWNTNFEICRVPISGGTKKWETLTGDNKAADNAPRFSPDGKRLAYRAQKRTGFEADRWQLLIVETRPDGTFSGQPKSATPEFDRSVDGFLWATDRSIIFTAEDNGSVPIWELHPGDGGTPKKLFEGGMNGSLSVSQDGKRLGFSNAALDHPAIVCTISSSGSKESLHRINPNAKLLSEIEMPRPESVQIPVEGGEMQMWVLKPPGFDPKKKWAAVYLVHGGPQGAWEDGWSFRWNPEVWAAQGYVIALPNPRGSTGFGQKFVDEISGDWGGKVYDDLMKGADYVEKLPYVDKTRIAAAGASFGGYMMNWFAVNTGRFKTLITHCGVWNFDSMYATTEELWFDEWEHGGPPWGKNRHSYEKFSPHRYAANLSKFKTPMLIIHNDHDYRVPVSEGLQLFTTLQRQGVPSRFVNFPDEGHWVLKPKNSEFWHKEVFGWLKKYVPPGGRSKMTR
jgi:dipeptidyl aminopeptidase/acylaminoacyl peptidase